VLLRDGRRAEAKIVPAIYHTLKTVSHVPLTIYALTAPVADAPFDDARRTNLRQYRDKLPGVAKCLADCGLADAALQRQQKLIAAGGAFLDGALENGKLTKDDLLGYV